MVQMVVRTLPFVLIATLLPAGAPAREIIWRAERPLTWDDFDGTVPGSAHPDNVAVTAAKLSWSYETDIEWSPRGCTYRITEIDATASFETDESWVRRGHRTAAVLAHEQGHFDITRIFALVFDEAARGLVWTTGACHAESARGAAAAAKREIKGRLEPLYERVWRRHTQAQAAYDAETRHGMGDDEQRRWNELIAAALNGRRWDELGAAAIVR